ncbi:CPXCG motif-containing cysteine-rich protein [Elusimicrobiota bacterium]
MPKRKKTARRTPAKAKKEGSPAESKPTGEADEAPDMSSLKKIFDEAVKVEEARPALQWVEVECPYCGETFEVCVDPGSGGQDMSRDCQVCTKSVAVAVEVEDGEINVASYRD